MVDVDTGFGGAFSIECLVKRLIEDGAAALDLYRAILRDASPKSTLDRMQPRAELYDLLGYHEFERKLSPRRSSPVGPPCPSARTPA